MVMAKQNGLCLCCLKNNEINLSQTVHHIIPVKDNYDKRLDVDNLIGVCYSHHQLIHNLYDKDDKTKQDTQELLLKIVNDWYSKNNV